MKDYFAIHTQTREFQKPLKPEPSLPSKVIFQAKNDPLDGNDGFLHKHIQKFTPSLTAVAQYDFEFAEQAAILEFEAGLTREQAEVHTALEMIGWYDFHCLNCGTNLEDDATCSDCSGQRGKEL